MLPKGLPKSFINPQTSELFHEPRPRERPLTSFWEVLGAYWDGFGMHFVMILACFGAVVPLGFNVFVCFFYVSVSLTFQTYRHDARQTNSRLKGLRVSVVCVGGASPWRVLCVRGVCVCVSCVLCEFFRKSKYPIKRSRVHITSNESHAVKPTLPVPLLRQVYVFVLFRSMSLHRFSYRFLEGCWKAT